MGWKFWRREESGQAEVRTEPGFGDIPTVGGAPGQAPVAAEAAKTVDLGPEEAEFGAPGAVPAGSPGGRGAQPKPDKSKEPPEDETVNEDRAQEVRLRARRRLIGAFVLLGGVVAFIPWFLGHNRMGSTEKVSVTIRNTAPVLVQTPSAAPDVDVAKGNPVRQYGKPKPAHAARDPEPESVPEPAPKLAEKPERPEKPAPKAERPAPKPDKPAAAKPAAASDDPIGDVLRSVEKQPGPQKADARRKASAEKPAAGRSLFVQAGAFGAERTAKAKVSEIRARGMAAYIKPTVNSKGVSLWQVRVGPFTDEDDARSARERLKRMGYQPSRVLSGDGQ